MYPDDLACSSYLIPFSPPVTFLSPVCVPAFIQRPQPEDGVPRRLHHAAGRHRISLHPLPWPPWRTLNCKIKSLKSNVITHTPYKAFISFSHPQTSIFPSLLCVSAACFLNELVFSDFILFFLGMFLYLHLFLHFAPQKVCLLYSVWWVLSLDQTVRCFSITNTPLSAAPLSDRKNKAASRWKFQAYFDSASRQDTSTKETQFHVFTSLQSRASHKGWPVKNRLEVFTVSKG